MTRILASGKLKLFVDHRLGAGPATVFAPASRVSVRILLCSHHEPPRVNEEFLRRPEATDSLRS